MYLRCFQVEVVRDLSLQKQSCPRLNSSPAPTHILSYEPRLAGVGDRGGPHLACGVRRELVCGDGGHAILAPPTMMMEFCPPGCSITRAWPVGPATSPRCSSRTPEADRASDSSLPFSSLPTWDGTLTERVRGEAPNPALHLNQYLSDKVGGVAQFGSTGCLIGSLATWQHSPRFSSNSLPRGRNAFHFDVHICICRTDNNQRGCHRLCVLLQDSRGFSVVSTWRGSDTQSSGTLPDYLHQSTVDNQTHTLRSALRGPCRYEGGEPTHENLVMEVVESR